MRLELIDGAMDGIKDIVWNGQGIGEIYNNIATLSVTVEDVCNCELSWYEIVSLASELPEIRDGLTNMGYAIDNEDDADMIDSVADLKSSYSEMMRAIYD